MILQIFKDLNNNNLELERINKTVDVIDSVIMQGYFSVIKFIDTDFLLLESH